MLLPSSDAAVTTKRILKVNHAGETGAIKIYGAQLFLARRRFPHIVPELDAMRTDEIEHCRLFREAMPARSARPCRVMALWSLGGYVLGLATALLGERMIWVCTEAVEATVHRHLEAQLAFLNTRDAGLHGMILSIQSEELAHLHEARHRQAGEKRFSDRMAYWIIAAATETLIWLSTWGDSGWMVPEMALRR